MTQKERIVAAKDWTTKYNGKNVIAGYAKWFGVDKVCAIRELKMIGISITENLENQILESHKSRINHKRKKKEKIEKMDTTVFESNDNFAFIVGYTSGGSPYGLTHEEFEKMEKDKAICNLQQFIN